MLVLAGGVLSCGIAASDVNREGASPSTPAPSSTSATTPSSDAFAASYKRHIAIGQPGSSQLRRLTGGLEPVDFDPAWDSLHERIAYSRNGDLYTMQVSSGERKRLTSRGYDSSPAWAPDGSQLVLTRTVRERSSVVVVSLADPRQANRLSAGYNPTWSPDGQWVAFNRLVSRVPRLFLIHPDGSGLRMIPNPPRGSVGSPAWNPADSRFIAVSGDSGLQVLDLRDERYQELTVTDETDMSPTWNSDGKRIMFVRVHCAARVGCENPRLMTVEFKPDGGVGKPENLGVAAVDPAW